MLVHMKGLCLRNLRPDLHTPDYQARTRMPEVAAHFSAVLMYDQHSSVRTAVPASVEGYNESVVVLQ